MSVQFAGICHSYASTQWPHSSKWENVTKTHLQAQISSSHRPEVEVGSFMASQNCVNQMCLPNTDKEFHWFTSFRQTFPLAWRLKQSQFPKRCGLSFKQRWWKKVIQIANNFKYNLPSSESFRIECLTGLSRLLPKMILRTKKEIK